MLFDYSNVIIFFVIGSLIGLLIVAGSYILAVNSPDPEKISVYECGFDPVGDSRQKFEVRFFLVAILFIIFDLEISFLFPWSSVLSVLPIFGYWTMYLFLFILTLGLIYEWLKGGLEWE